MRVGNVDDVERVSVEVQVDAFGEGHHGQRALGRGGTFWFMAVMNCSVDMRFRTLSCATITDRSSRNSRSRRYGRNASAC
jgi:hypothetical protein